MTELEIMLLQALKTARDALDLIGEVKGPGIKFTARETMPSVFSVIDMAIKATEPKETPNPECWFCEGTGKYRGLPCLICTEPGQ
jgi:hypothetical protein